MKLNITRESFERDATSKVLKEIALAHYPCGFWKPEFDRLVPYLGSPEDFGAFVDEISAGGVSNGDVFHEIDTAAECMIGAAFDLLRILALWRGRYLLGESASIVELPGYPKIAVMCAEANNLCVRYENVLITEPIANEDARARARELLSSMTVIHSDTK